MNSFKYIILIIPHIILLAISAGCGKQNAIREKLEYVNKMTETNPDAALACLDSMRNEEMSEADRIFYDFLSIKGSDKAYIDHKSDSLFLNVLKYYSKHSRDKLYPEVLYYGGRVYSDLGDFPTALSFFQDALDIIPDKKEYLKLKGIISSQAGRLLYEIKLYDSAITHINNAIDVNTLLCDSSSIMFNTQLLGSIYRGKKNYNTAETYFKKSLQMAQRVNTTYIPFINMHLASLKYNQGELDSALNIIRDNLTNIDSVSLYPSLSYASWVYLEANKLDTALMYAKQAIDNNSYKVETAYSVVLSPKLRSYIPEDTLFSYLEKYRSMLEKSLNQNEDKLAILQNARYNYKIHEREKINAEQEVRSLREWLYVALSVILALVSVVSYMKYRKQHKMLRFYQIIDKIKKIRSSFVNNKYHNDEDITQSDDNEIDIYNSNEEKHIDDIEDHHEHSNGNMQQPIVELKKVDSLRDRLLNELFKLQQESKNKHRISPVILNSTSYSGIQEYLKKDKAISEGNPLWRDIEDTILSCSENFKYRVSILMGEEIKPTDYNLLLLIKCGFTPTQSSILMGKTKATISYRRNQLSIKAFGEKLDTKILDGLIRCL